MDKTGTAGNKGPGIRSDVWVMVSPAGSGGLQIDINSKVKTLFGRQIRALTEKIVHFFELEHAQVVIEDTGAVDFVLAARLEAAIKQVVQTDKEFLLPLLDENKMATKKDDFRFSRLYLPGNSPKLMLNAGVHKPNGLILDLEDAVAPAKKTEARFLVRNALRTLRFYGAERMVRINQGKRGLDDLEFVIPHFANMILIPKCEEVTDVRQVVEKTQKLLRQNEMSYSGWFMPIIESAKGVINAYAIASADQQVAAMAIGLEDYTADLGTRRTKEGTESFFARSMVVNAARAAGIQPINSVFSDVSDMVALAENEIGSKSLGFDRMGRIHPL